jgi:UDP-2,4-diacetamido-2,4,6-trideoxy-beta-L-altropyranose hydrolase
LADALRRRGADVRFVCRAEEGHLNGWLTQQGFEVHALPGEPDELPAMNALLDTLEQPPDWLVVDHYRLDARWESTLRPRVGRIFVIDDLADRPHDCDALLDQNRLENSTGTGEGTGPYHARVSPQTRLFLGPRYALLRPPFAQARERLKTEREERVGPVQRLLAFFGGTDPTGETFRAVEALDRLALSPSAAGADKPGPPMADIIVGSGNPRRKEIAQLCAERPHLRFHEQTEDMAGLMTAADLAITAGGATTWERLCLGLPGLVVAVAGNQIALSREVASAGAQVFLGRSERLADDALPPDPETEALPVVTVDLLHAALVRWTADAPGRRRMSRRALSLVDGRGAERVAAFLVLSGN